MSKRMHRVGVWGLALTLFAASGMAQEAAEDASEGPTPRTQRDASSAYDRATTLYADGDYAQAGRWFMTAYRLVPAEAALIQAVRSYQHAEQLDRAGNLALMLQEYHADSATAAELAAQNIAAASATLYRVDVECEGCALSVDETLYAAHSVFVTPAVSHEVVAQFGAQRVVREVSGSAGESETLVVDAPPVAVPEPPVEVRETGTPVRPPPPPPSRGLHRALFITLAAATVAAGAATIVLGLDARGGLDEYVAMPTREAYEQGQRKERRTNALIGVTAGLAALSVLTAIFTDWGEDATQVGVSASREGAFAFVGGTL